MNVADLNDVFARHVARTRIAARAERLRLTPEAEAYLEARSRAAIVAAVHTALGPVVVASKKKAR